jgi:hypothetical protein
LFGLGCTEKAQRGLSSGAGLKQNIYNITVLSRCPEIYLSPFCLANSEIIEVKVNTDRQTKFRHQTHALEDFF